MSSNADKDLHKLLNDDPDLYKYRYEVPEDDSFYDYAAGESLWLRRVREGVFKVVNVLFFVRGYSFEDEVELVEYEGRWVTRIRLLKSSGNSSVTLHYVEEKISRDVLLNKLIGLGIDHFEFGMQNFVAISVPSDVDYFGKIRSELDALTEQGAIYFEEVVMRHHQRRSLLDRFLEIFDN